MVDREQDRASARVGGRSDRGSLRCPARGLATQCCPFVLLLAAPPPGENGKREEKRVCAGHSGMDSEGGDVVECVVQLLADGLVLHLLCVDFVWGVRKG